MKGYVFELPKISDLAVSKITDEMVLYEPFLLINIKTPTTFPSSDEPYYTSLEMQLRHLLYKYEKKWITSERQVMFTSDECISTIHFLFDGNNEVNTINVFQRSSNVNNLLDDVQFINYFVEKYLFGKEVETNIFVSAPHRFINKESKLG